MPLASGVYVLLVNSAVPATSRLCFRPADAVRLRRASFLNQIATMLPVLA